MNDAEQGAADARRAFERDAAIDAQIARDSRVEPVIGPLSGARSDLPSMPPPAASLRVSAPAGQEDARDAKRYRWLRYFNNFAQVDAMLDTIEYNTLDAAVDAAMSATTKEN